MRPLSGSVDRLDPCFFLLLFCLLSIALVVLSLSRSDHVLAQTRPSFRSLSVVGLWVPPPNLTRAIANNNKAKWLIQDTCCCSSRARAWCEEPSTEMRSKAWIRGSFIFNLILEEELLLPGSSRLWREPLLLVPQALPCKKSRMAKCYAASKIWNRV